MAVEELWAQFQQALKNYQETTEERKKAFEELKHKDDRSSKEIETQMRKLQRLTVGCTFVHIELHLIYKHKKNIQRF